MGTYITREEAYESLEDGKRVLFHYKGRSVEVTQKTTFSHLRWELMARNTLTVNDVLSDTYTVIV